MDKIKLTVETEPQAEKKLLNFLDTISWRVLPASTIDRSFFYWHMMQYLVADGYDVSCYHAFQFVESVFNKFYEEREELYK